MCHPPRCSAHVYDVSTKTISRYFPDPRPCVTFPRRPAIPRHHHQQGRIAETPRFLGQQPLYCSLISGCFDKSFFQVRIKFVESSLLSDDENCEVALLRCPGGQRRVVSLSQSVTEDTKTAVTRHEERPQSCGTREIQIAVVVGGCYFID